MSYIGILFGLNRFIFVGLLSQTTSYSGLECLLNYRLQRRLPRFLRWARLFLIREFMARAGTVGALDLDDLTGLCIDCNGQYPEAVLKYQQMISAPNCFYLAI